MRASLKALMRSVIAVFFLFLVRYKSIQLQVHNYLVFRLLVILCIKFRMRIARADEVAWG